MKKYIIELNRSELIKLINVINNSNKFDHINYGQLIKCHDYGHFKIELDEYELKKINRIIKTSNDYDYYERLKIEGDIASALCYWKLKMLKNKRHEIYN